MRRKRAASLLTVAFIIFAAFLSAFLLRDRVVIYLLERYAEAEVSYDRISGDILSKSELEGLSVIVKGRGVIINAEKALIDLDGIKLLTEKVLDVSCEFNNVNFYIKGISGGEGGAAGDVMSLPFSPAQKYSRISFEFKRGRDTLVLSDLRAVSDSVRMEGGCSFYQATDKMSLKLKISFSPETAMSMPENIRDNMLTQEEDGWYSTVIDFTGNPLFLKAVYSIAVP